MQKPARAPRLLVGEPGWPMRGDPRGAQRFRLEVFLFGSDARTCAGLQPGLTDSVCSLHEEAPRLRNQTGRFFIRSVELGAGTGVVL